ncbi:MAG: 50S ribosomal protein L9 [Candidatus Gracilibacteria bacterium]|nr:50S ribosomal protein L9 [Candidatus Gracilibacteria bacterium]
MTVEKLKIQMLKRVAGIGKEGEIVEVSYSQAKNYLIPKGLAKLVSKEQVEALEKKKDNQVKNLKSLIYNRHKIAESLNGKEIIFQAKGSGDKIFGGIQELDIIERLNKEFGIKFDKKHVILPDGHHLKKVGKYDIKLNLGTDVYVKIILDLRVIS